MTAIARWFEYGTEHTREFADPEAAARHLAHLWMSSDGAPVGIEVDGALNEWTPEQARPYHHDTDYDHRG